MYAPKIYKLDLKHKHLPEMLGRIGPEAHAGVLSRD